MSEDQDTGEIITSSGLEMSPFIGTIMEAIAAAQGEIENASKEGKNPHFNSKYATLAAVYEACRASLSKHGVAVIQAPFNVGNGDIGVTTVLGHKSGEWLRSTLCVKPVKFDAQGAGSVITYLRRYSLSAMVGVAPEDDDGEAGVGRPDGKKPATKSNGDDKAKAARDYANAAMAKVKGMTDPVAFSEWHQRNREVIAKVRDYDEKLHHELIDVLTAADVRLSA